jgi:hypothetical protein
MSMTFYWTLVLFGSLLQPHLPLLVLLGSMECEVYLDSFFPHQAE